MAFVRSNDGRVTAFDAATGERRWLWAHDMPLLTVRGNDAPSLGPAQSSVGTADGTLPPLPGSVALKLWTQVTAQPDGSTDPEPMADFTGPTWLHGALIQ